MRRGLVAAVLSGLIVGSAGVAVGIAATRLDPPASLATADPAKLIRVDAEPFADPRSVQLRLTQDPGVALVTHATGTVTRATCAPGTQVRSGTAPWSVDGRPLVALSTRTPLYRDLASGDHGDDVAGLQTELRRLGLPAPATAVFDATTMAALNALWSRLGLPGTTWLDHTAIVWLPAPTVALAQCQAATGAEIAAGTPLATTNATTTAATVDPTPTDLVTGARVVDVEGRKVPVPRSGIVPDGPALARLLTTELGQLALRTLSSDQPVPLEATLSLARPISSVTVPASAVLTGSGTCVLDGSGKPHPVTVISSELGRSILTFTDSPAPTHVVIAPPRSASCG